MSRHGLVAMVLLFACVTTMNSASGQTPMATAGAVEGRSYENTCDGAQAYFYDWQEATDAYFEHDRTWMETWEFHLAHYRELDPPPILQQWTDVNIDFWAAGSDHFDIGKDPMSLLDAIHDAEDELEDMCEGLRIYRTD